MGTIIVAMCDGAGFVLVVKSVVYRKDVLTLRCSCRVFDLVEHGTTSAPKSEWKQLNAFMMLRLARYEERIQ